MEPLDWPLPGLRLRTPDLLLRPTTEADLSAVEATLSADIATDPRLPRFPESDAALRADPESAACDCDAGSPTAGAGNLYLGVCGAPLAGGRR
jgi:hypothetical protein